MKITVDIDCTPQEARAFLGLPDLEPFQQEILEEMQKVVRKNMSAMDAEQVMKTMLPMVGEGMDKWQQLFWNLAGGTAGKGDRSGSGGSK